MDILLIGGIILLVIAIVAYLLGAQGVAGMTAQMGKWFLAAFLIIAVVLFILRALR